MNVFLLERQLFACRNADHLLDEVEAGDQFSHRVFHLQAGVHFEEVERLVLPNNKLNRTGRLILHRFSQRHSLFTHGLTGGRVDERRRCFFDHLLVTALNRAVTFVQIHDVAVRVTQHLNFDMAWLFNKFLDKDAIITKSILGFVLARGEPFVGFLIIEGNTQPLAATARRGLDHDRVTNAFGNFNRLFRRVDWIVVTRNGINLGFVGQLFRGDLIAHRFQCVDLRSDEDDAVGFELLAEFGVFREEAVARVNCLSARLLAGRNDLVDDQVRLL